MPDLSFLFTPPSIEKLKANKDLAGLTKALNYTRDASIPRAAAAALLSLDAYLPAYESAIKTGGAATADRLEADLLAVMQQPTTHALCRVRAAQVLSSSVNEDRYKAAIQVLLAEGKFDELHNKLEESRQAERLHSMKTLTEQTYAQESQPLRHRAWAAGYLLRWQEEPFAAFLLENYHTLFERLHTLFTYEDVVKNSPPWCNAGAMREPYLAYIACQQGLAHLPEHRLDALAPFLEFVQDIYSKEAVKRYYLTAWTVDILCKVASETSTSMLRQVLMTHPNLHIRHNAYMNISLYRGWKAATMEERLAAIIASGATSGLDEIINLGIEAIPTIEAALTMPMITGGRERDGRERRDVYFELRSALEILEHKAHNTR